MGRFHTRSGRNSELNRQSFGVGDADGYHGDKACRGVKSDGANKGILRFTGDRFIR